jgi:PAS domain S-box-containing protein
MDESVTIPRAEIERLRERVRKLAMEKSYLQLVNDLMNELNRVPGLDRTIDEMLRLLLNNIGGTSISLYYLIHEQLYFADVYGRKWIVKDLTDSMVRQALATRQPVEQDEAYDETKMTTPEFTRASYWALPLLVGDQLVGVLKMEGMLMAAEEVRRQLQPFIKYAALVLKNEIENYARLSEFNAMLQRTNESLMQSQTALRGANEQLEVRVAQRTAELQGANAMLEVQLNERKRAEEALRKKTEELDNFFDIAPDLLCVANTDGYFLRLNLAWERTLGFTAPELIETRFLDFVHPEDVATTLEAIATLSAQQNIVDFVNRYRCRDGTYRWIEWRSVPSGRLIYAAARDITEQRAAEAELLRHRDHLEELVTERTCALEAVNRELEAFSYSVSHDLRTPLRAIEGFSRLLELKHVEHLDADARRLVQVVRQNAMTMARLIDDILSFSRCGRAELRTSRIDMDQLVRSVWSELEPDRVGREIRFELAALPPAEGDLSMVRQVWVNLLGNAIKFTGLATPALIEVRGARAGETNTYFVKDNGVGFDEAYAHKLFGVFQRLHGIDEFPGTGIGLAIVKRIVTRHGGEATARGKVGEGAEVRFSLPAREGSHP